MARALWITLLTATALLGCGDGDTAGGGEDPPEMPAAPETPETPEAPDTPETDDWPSHRPSGVRRVTSYAEAGLGYPDFAAAEGRWNGLFAEDCAGTRDEVAFACGEQLFWQALQFETDGRAELWGHLRAHNARLDAEGLLDTRWLAVLYWRSAQLGVAYITEQLIAREAELPPEELVQYGLPLQSEIDRAVALDPENVEIASWKVMLEGSSAGFLGQDREPYVARLYDLYEENPLFVLGTFIGAASGASMASGWPDVAVDAIDETLARCETEDCSIGPTPHVPWAGVGTDFTYAEIMARVGDRARARAFLIAATERAEFEAWPYRFYVDDALADLDGFVDAFATLGEEGLAFQSMVVNGPHACMMCHDPR